MVEKKAYPVSHVVNWYYGNFCARKCFDKEERLFECWTKLRAFADNNKDLKIRHKEFKDLFDEDHIKICKLSPGFRRKSISWKQFEYFSRDSDFDPDKL